MAEQPERDWRHWLGTLLIAAAVAFLVSAWISPPDPSQPAAYRVGYYSGGVLFLAAGWWLRRLAGRDD